MIFNESPRSLVNSQTTLFSGETTMTEKQPLIHDNDSRAIPFTRIQEVFDKVPRAHPVRVMFRMAFLTGCRLSELTTMKVKFIRDGYIYWELGKNQSSFRKEKLPADFLAELTEYRNNHCMKGGRVFHITHNTLRRMFNRDIRPMLSDYWRQKRLRPRAGQLVREHVLQLNGLRKTFQTYYFYHEYKKRGDASFAIEMVSKRMKHSTTHMTAHHYIQNFDALQIDDYGVEKPIFEVLDQAHQLRLVEWI